MSVGYTRGRTAGLTYLRGRVPATGAGAPITLVVLHGSGDNEEGLVGFAEALAGAADFAPFAAKGRRAHHQFLKAHGLGEHARAGSVDAPSGVEIFSLRAPIPIPEFDGYRWFEGMSAAPAASAKDDQAAALRAVQALLIDEVLLKDPSLSAEMNAVAAQQPPAVLSAWGASCLRSRVLVAGFSQGGSMAWQLAYFFGYDAAVLSGRLMPWITPADHAANTARLCGAPTCAAPTGAADAAAAVKSVTPEALELTTGSASARTRVLMTHGSTDTMTPVRFAQASAALADAAFGERLDLRVNYDTYAHTLRQDELLLIADWLRA